MSREEAERLMSEPPNCDPELVELVKKRLGFSDKAIKNIIKYRTAKGKFYTPEDLKKIYTLSLGSVGFPK